MLNAHNKLEKARNVIIVGGGLVGVELAGEICTHYKDKIVFLVEGNKHLISRQNPKTIRYIERFLEDRKVKLLLEHRINNFKKRIYYTNKGEEIKADIIFICVGIRPNFEFMQNNFSKALNEKGQIIVDECLRVRGEKRIFSAGDVTAIEEEKTAQNAEKHAKIIVRNIIAIERGEDLIEYRPKKRFMVISLGKYDGVLEYRNFVLRGKIPAFLKWAIEKRVMLRYRIL